MKEFKIGLWFVFRLMLNSIFGASTFKLPYLKNKHGYKKQIFWECGGGYANYYYGVAQAIKELYSPEILKNIVWTGASAGTIISYALTVTQETPKAIFAESVKCSHDLVAKRRFGAFYCLNDYLIERYYAYEARYPSVFVNENCRLFPASLHLNWLCPFLSYLSFSYNFENTHESAHAGLASHGFPIVLGSLQTTLLSHPTKWYILRIDGGLLTLLLGSIFGYAAILPYGSTIPSSVIHPATFRPIIWSELWAYCSAVRYQNMYNLGYQDAMDHKFTLNKLIL